MSSTVLETMKEDMTDAGMRVLAAKLTEGIQHAILSFLKSKGAKRKELKTFEKWMGSKYGQAFIGIVLGLLVEHVDWEFFKNETVKRLAEEMKSNGYVILFNELFSEILGQIMDVYENVASKVPEAKALRLETPLAAAQTLTAPAASATAAKPVVR